MQGDTDAAAVRSLGLIMLQLLTSRYLSFDWQLTADFPLPGRPPWLPGNWQVLSFPGRF